MEEYSVRQDPRLQRHYCQTSGLSESTIRSTRRGYRSPLELEAEHGITIDVLYVGEVSESIIL